MTSRLVQQLRSKARGYELNAVAAGDSGDKTGALAFSTIAVTLLELAETFEHELEEAA